MSKKRAAPIEVVDLCSSSDAEEEEKPKAAAKPRQAAKPATRELSEEEEEELPKVFRRRKQLPVQAAMTDSSVDEEDDEEEDDDDDEEEEEYLPKASTRGRPAAAAATRAPGARGRMASPLGPATKRLRRAKPGTPVGSPRMVPLKLVSSQPLSQPSSQSGLDLNSLGSQGQPAASPRKPPQSITSKRVITDWLRPAAAANKPSIAPARHAPSAAVPLPTRGNAMAKPGAAQPGAAATTTARAATAAAAAADQCLGSVTTQSGVSWVDKHRPRRVEDLAVQNKKVEQVRSWLDSQLPGNRLVVRTPRLAVLAGPSGCGKSTTVHLLAQQLGFKVVEWSPATTTTWSEAQYQQQAWSGPGSSAYMSKLDEFEAFINRVKNRAAPLKLVPVPPASTATAPTQQPGQHVGNASSTPPSSSQEEGPARGLQLVLIDDLPLVNDSTRRAQLASILQGLASSSRCPVVIISTETKGSGAGEGGRVPLDKGTALHKDIHAALESVGLAIITFNAVTKIPLTKVLQQVAQVEDKVLSKAAAEELAMAADGDIRQALQALQLMFAQGAQRGVAQGVQLPAPTKGKRGGKAAAAPKRAAASKELLPHEAARLAPLRRDQGLDFFHAIGKIMYNKRGEEDGDSQPAADNDADAGARGRGAAGHSRGGRGGKGSRGGGRPGVRPLAVLSDLPSLKFTEEMLHVSHRRLPMRYDPEDVINKAGAEPMPLVSFLAANYLTFVGDQELDAAADAAAYLSDAAFLAHYRSPNGGGYSGYWGEEETTANGLTAAAACSIATRGLLYANPRPARLKMLVPMGGSKLPKVEAAVSANQSALQHMAQQLTACHGCVVSANCGTALVTQLLPSMRILACHPAYAWLHSVMPTRWSQFSNGEVTQQGWVHQGSVAARVRQLAGELREAGIHDVVGAGQQQQQEQEEEEDPIEDD